MGGRQLRKQMKLKEPEPIFDSESSSSSSSEEIATNAFAMLNPVSSSESESDSSESTVEVDIPKPVPATEKQKQKSTNIDLISSKDFDALLKQQEWDIVESHKEVPKMETTPSALFKINPKLFNFEAELNRQFGTNYSRFTKAQLVQLNPNWPRFHNCGLSLHSIDSNQQYCHSKQYQDIEFQFLNFFVTMDIPSILHLNQLYPTHLNTLLLVSEQHRQSNVDGASDFIQRGLLVLQKSINYNNFKLNFKIQENRSFFIFLLKHIYYMNRKGAWNTSFELSKFLLSADLSDPVCISSLIDFQALMAKQYEWLDDFVAQSDVLKYPNLLYSQALSSYLQNNPNDDLLLKAFLNCPNIGLDLLHHPVDDLFSGLYKQQHSKLWTEQAASQWLQRIGSQYLESLKALEPPVAPVLVPNKAMYRFMVIMDYDLFKFIPENQRHLGILFDPFPPATGGYMTYLKTQMDQRTQLFDRQTISSSTHPLSGLLQTLLPWINNVDDENRQDEADEELE